MDPYELYEQYEKHDEAPAQQPPRRGRKREISFARIIPGTLCMMASFALLLAMNGKLQIPWPNTGIPVISILSSQEGTGSVYEATGSAVNIRSGPGMEYDAFSRALQGETLKATGKISSDGAWIEVICPDSGQYGWASADYMRKLS